MRLLADTHILLRWLFDAKKLTKNQAHALELSVQRAEPVGISAITLIEIAILIGEGSFRPPKDIDAFFDDLQGNPVFQIVPIGPAIAADFTTLPRLRDPMDRTIAATARCHRLKLVTSDQRIIDSGLVPTIF